MNQIADINAFTLFYCLPKNPVVYFFFDKSHVCQRVKRDFLYICFFNYLCFIS